MTNKSEETPLRSRSIVVSPPDDAIVDVQHDVALRAASGESLLADVYTPGGGAAPCATVVIAAGYRDSGFQAAVGCRFKEMGWTTSWARLFAASGIAAVTYTTEAPEDDLPAVLGAISARAESLRLVAHRLALFASSGHGPVALAALMDGFPVEVSCTALAYAYTLDLDGAGGVAEAAAKFRFANPCDGRPFADYRATVPLLLVRAGRDEMPRLNETMDRFIAAVLARNGQMEVFNHADGTHAFDLTDDSERSKAAIEAVRDFFVRQLH